MDNIGVNYCYCQSESPNVKLQINPDFSGHKASWG